MGMGGGPPVCGLLTPALKNFLAHYGITIDPSYVLDESCYRQQLPPQQGGGDQNIYFAPIIKDANIDRNPRLHEQYQGVDHHADLPCSCG